MKTKLNVSDSFRGRPAKLAGVLAAIAVVAIALQPAITSAVKPEPTYSLRGVQVQAAAFSLGSLHTPTERAGLEAARSQAFTECMSGKGFSEAPAKEEEPTPDNYSGRYALAATGDDVAATEPPAVQSVQMPDGGSFEISVSWTPDSCMWRAFAHLGSDPLQREALRQSMMILLSRADGAATARLADETSAWANCLDVPSADPYDLLRAVDGAGARPGLDGLKQSCLSDDLVSKVREVRGSEAIRVASENSEIVDAWVALIDSEVEAARVRVVP